MEAYERAHLEKNKKTAQTVIGQVRKKIKTDSPAVNEIEEEVIVICKESRMTDFWSKAVQKKKSKVTN